MRASRLSLLAPLTIAGFAALAPTTAFASATGTPAVAVTEVAAWGSSTAPYNADWWELTNFGSTPLTITGWKMDDDSDAYASAVALNGVTTIAAGESVLFTEGTASTAASLRAAYSIPASVQIGYYSGSGVGLSATSDQVNIFASATSQVAHVAFGTSTTGVSFDNAAGIDGTLTTLSQNGVNGATVIAGATISPGTIGAAPTSDLPEFATPALALLAGGVVLGGVAVVRRRNSQAV